MVGCRQQERFLVKTIIHAGSLKTGSTYLQSVIWKNLHAFENVGILVPQTGVVSHHHYDVARAAGFGYPAQQLRDDKAAEILGALSQELSGREEGVALLSSEHFDLGVSEKSVLRLLQTLAGHDVRVVIYLRNQVDLMQSLYFEYLKWGGVKDFASFTAHTLNQGTLAYDVRISKWVDAGVDVCGLDYNVERADLLGSLLAEIPGAPPQDELILPGAPVNESLSPEAMEYVREMNARMSSPADRRAFYEKFYATMHRRQSPWTKSRLLPLPAVLADALPGLSQRNRRLADMLGKGEDFLQGDLVAYAAQRGERDTLDMAAFRADLEDLGMPSLAQSADA